MKNEVNVLWNKKMSFTADINGHKIELDADINSGGENKGTRPKPLMLVALAGCTGMDVVSILEKMKVKLNYFNVKVIGEVREEHPKRYTEMSVIYELKGDNLEYEKIEKAVKLSQEKYCGVLAFYKEVIKVNYEIKLL